MYTFYLSIDYFDCGIGSIKTLIIFIGVGFYFFAGLVCFLFSKTQTKRY